MGGQCDWGNYFNVISAQPTDYGFKGLWTSAAWIDAPHDLDAVRMSAGCAVEVATEDDGGGQSYTFTSDVRVCGNEVGCDRIRSIRVFKQGADDHVCTCLLQEAYCRVDLRTRTRERARTHTHSDAYEITM